MSESKGLEYILSGPAYMRIVSKKSYTDERTAEDVRRVFSHLNSIYQNHDFSILYNAYTEKNFTEPIAKVYRPAIKNVYTDSGGLQLVSLGDDISEEAKRKVYATQAIGSDYAMIFDEIPVTRNPSMTNTSLGSRNSRIFEEKLLIPNAKKTAQNIKNQLDFFEECGADTNVIMIVHGNTITSMMQWFETIIEELDEHYTSRIGSVAISSAAIGSGALEEVQKTLLFKFVSQQYGFDHLHLLGVGSYRNLIPCASVLSSLIREGKVRVSYDSTSQSMSEVNGVYVKKDGRYLPHKIGRAYNKIYHDVFQEMVEFYPATLDSFADDRAFHEAFILKGMDAEKKYGTLYERTLATVLFNSYSINNMINVIEKVFYDDAFKKESIGRDSRLTPLLHLDEVNNMSDYNHWYSTVGKYMATRPVEGINTNSLESFFST